MGTRACGANRMASAAKPLQERFSTLLLAVQRMAGRARQAKQNKHQAEGFHRHSPFGHHAVREAERLPAAARFAESIERDQAARHRGRADQDNAVPIGACVTVPAEGEQRDQGLERKHAHEVYC
jgi:hypothetical protein